MAATEASVAQIHAGLTNGDHLLNEAEIQNARILRGVEELPLEDIANQLNDLARVIGAAATTVGDFPIAEGQQRRAQAEVQYDLTFERTGRHPNIDALYGALGAMGQQYNQAGAFQGALVDRLTGWSTVLAGIVQVMRTEGVGLRGQIKEHTENATAYSQKVRSEGEHYRGII
jgi:hypothetical protein